jgi:ribosomal protein L11 methyltransferase
MTNSKTWLSVWIAGSVEAVESTENHAFELGASGLEETSEGLRIYFPQKNSRKKIRDNFNGFVRSLRMMGYSISDPIYGTIQEEDWGSRWTENFKPIRVGSKIVVKPPWESWHADSFDIVIDIVPKMAFGTGSHETTRLCLEMLERFIKSSMTVLDAGTGSGILAIAAVKLGASHVDATDIEEESIENATENCRLNGVGRQMSVRLESLEILPSKSYDLILANIDRKTLVPMLPKFAAYGRSGTILILSGILVEEKHFILDSLSKSVFRLIETKELGEWAGLAAVLI